MILPIEQNQFKSGIDKPSIRDIMNIYDLSKEQQPLPINFEPPKIGTRENPSLFPTPNSYEKPIPQQLIPVETSKSTPKLIPAAHIDSQQSIFFDTVEEYQEKQRRRMMGEGKSQRNKSKRRIFDRVKVKQKGMGFTFDQGYQKMFNNAGPSLLHQDNGNDYDSKIQSQNKGLKLVSSNNQRQSFNHDTKTLLSDYQFQKALSSDISNNLIKTSTFPKKKTSIQSVQSGNKNQSCLLSSKQGSSIKSKDAPCIHPDLPPCVHSDDRSIGQIFKSENSKIIKHIIKLDETKKQQKIKEQQQKKVKKINKIVTKVQSKQMPNSPFKMLQKQIDGQLQEKGLSHNSNQEGQELEKRVTQVEEKLQVHSKLINTLSTRLQIMPESQIKASSRPQIQNVGQSIQIKPFLKQQIKPAAIAQMKPKSQNKMSQSNTSRNLQKKSVHIQSQSKTEQYIAPSNSSLNSIYKNTDSSKQLIRQRQQRMEEIKKENSRLLMEIDSQNFQSFDTNYDRPVKKSILSDPQPLDTPMLPHQIHPNIDKHGKPKYFILSSPAERDSISHQPQQPPSHQPKHPQVAAYLSPFNLDPKSID